ncbi:MAG: Fah30 [Neobacillus sp.]|nr:Fah30 [Neobacillus sp.]
MTNKDTIYQRIFIDLLRKNSEETTELDRDTLKKLVYFGCKFVRTLEDVKTQEDISKKMGLILYIRGLIAKMTPVELINVFPIIKEYDGDKYCIKDYFYTKAEMDKLKQDEPIGELVDNLLWDYNNNDVRYFLMNQLSTASDIRKMNGQKGIAEEFCEENGIETYTMYKAANGCKFIQSNTTGRTSKVKRKFPRYLRLAK